MRRRLLLGLIGALAAAAALLAAGFLLGRWRAGREAVTSAPVVQAVRRIARLATIEMEIADVVRYEEVKTILVFDIPKNATLRLRGRVLGGFDLANGLDVRAEPDRRFVHVRLPAPQVIAVDDRLEWFDERSGWLNPITPDDRTRWTQWARGALARAAKDAGLYEKSSQHARDLFEDTAAAFGWTADVTVNGARIPPSAPTQAAPAPPKPMTDRP